MQKKSGYGSDDTRYKQFLGDNYCAAGALCLKDLTIKKLSEECSRHFGNNGNDIITVLWEM